MRLLPETIDNRNQSTGKRRNSCGVKARTFIAADSDDPWTLTDPRGLRWDLYVTGHLNRKTEQLESVYNPRFPESSRYGRVHERAGESNSAFPKSRDHVHT